MKLSYKKLWVKLVERDLKKTEFARKAGISSASLANLGKDANITTDELFKICEYLDSDKSDKVELIKADDDSAPESQNEKQEDKVNG